jgi:hypothetical protein
MLLAAELLAVLLLAVLPARGQESGPGQGEPHHHPPQDVHLHETFYSTWMRPDQRNAQGGRFSSCCNKQVCYPTTFEKRSGWWYARRREDGAWIRVPPGVLESEQLDPRESPDGGNHVCMPPPNHSRAGEVYCAVLGSGQ